MTVAYQATCLVIDARAILIEGQPGSGKSSLALALIDRGAQLVGDDSVLLEALNGHLIAHPHPNTRGLLEVRNVGLVSMPVQDVARLALVLRLDPDAPRYIDEAESCIVAGIALPLVRLWPESPVLALRTELALARYGLPVA